MTSPIDISGDGGILKKVLREGSGECPPSGSKVTVHYTGTLLDGTKFDSSVDRNEPFVFTIGRGQVIKGWDQGVATMKVGELAVLTCAADYAYGRSGSPPTIPPNATLQFEVELLDFSSSGEEEPWMLSTEEKMKRSVALKSDGNDLFKEGKLTVALIKYRKALKLWEGTSDLEPEQQASANEVQLSCQLNIAACELKLKNYGKAIDACNAALKIDSTSVKGIYRRGQAHVGRGDLEEARGDFKTALAAQPGNKEAAAELKAVEAKLEAHKQTEKRMYQKMFS